VPVLRIVRNARPNEERDVALPEAHGVGLTLELQMPVLNHDHRVAPFEAGCWRCPFSRVTGVAVPIGGRLAHRTRECESEFN
jgi:hypothetical protein